MTIRSEYSIEPNAYTTIQNKQITKVTENNVLFVVPTFLQILPQKKLKTLALLLTWRIFLQTLLIWRLLIRFDNGVNSLVSSSTWLRHLFLNNIIADYPNEHTTELVIL